MKDLLSAHQKGILLNYVKVLKLKNALQVPGSDVYSAKDTVKSWCDE